MNVRRSSRKKVPFHRLTADKFLALDISPMMSARLSADRRFASAQGFAGLHQKVVQAGLVKILRRHARLDTGLAMGMKDAGRKKGQERKKRGATNEFSH